MRKVLTSPTILALVLSGGRVQTGAFLLAVIFDGMDKKQLGLFEREEIKAQPERKMYISSDQSESNINSFLQSERNRGNVMLNGYLISDYTTLHDMKLLKRELFIWDDKEKKWFYKTPHNWRHYILMMKQFKQYSGEQI